MLKLSSRVDPNFDVRSVCDLWSVNRDKAADAVQKMFGTRPKTFKYSEEMLADQDLDAVMIGTGDHQHARLLAEVVRPGKDCYCEKPMANTLEDAKLARDAVKAGRQVVQMGSQWLSDPYQHKVREMIREGRLGKVVSISQSWNFNGPRWHVPNDDRIAMIREQDTDWERWLLGRAKRPFDPRAYFEFRIFKDFSGGITDQWYSHGAGLAHFYLDTFIPDDTVSGGGIFAWHDVRENPDTFQCLSTFADKQVLYSYGTTFGSAYGDHTIIRGTKGTLALAGRRRQPAVVVHAGNAERLALEHRLRPALGTGQASARHGRRARPTRRQSSKTTTCNTTPTTGCNACAAARRPTAASRPALPTPWQW